MVATAGGALYRESSGTGVELVYLGHVCLDTKSREVLATAVTKAHTSAEWEAGVQLLDEGNDRVGGVMEVVSAGAGGGVDWFLAQVEARGRTAHIPMRGGLRGVRVRQRRHKVLPHVRPEQEPRERLGAQGRERAIMVSKTGARPINRKLRLWVKHFFGEARMCHGRGRARYRGLAKVAPLAAVVINLKRLALYLRRGQAPGNVAAMRAAPGRAAWMWTNSRQNRLFSRPGALFSPRAWPHHRPARVPSSPT